MCCKKFSASTDFWFFFFITVLLRQCISLKHVTHFWGFHTASSERKISPDSILGHTGQTNCQTYNNLHVRVQSIPAMRSLPWQGLTGQKDMQNLCLQTIKRGLLVVNVCDERKNELPVILLKPLARSQICLPTDCFCRVCMHLKDEFASHNDPLA